MVATAKSSRTLTPRKPATATTLSKRPAKPNASILSFFPKTQRPEDSLFVGAGCAPVDDIYSRNDEGRFEGSTLPSKKRKVDYDSAPLQHADIAESLHHKATEPAQASVGCTKIPKLRLNMPFIIDSESEEEEGEESHGSPRRSVSPGVEKASGQLRSTKSEDTHPDQIRDPNYTVQSPSTDLPSVHFGDSFGDGVAEDFDHFSATDEVDLDEFEGEEMRERLFMQEQALLEAEEAGVLLTQDLGQDSFRHDDATQTCPICNASLEHVSMDEATRHVNSCLDGDPIPLFEIDKDAALPVEVDSADLSKRFARAAVPRPGQVIPFELDDDNKNAGQSAFSKLMSSKAEDSAWAAAAAAENASRGRPAYERTCPFYKIIPGFNICVDAFRYGAVKGCEAYFLSHFHSDHYIGLTANWTHGPIYCSKVTGSLVKQQLRTAAKWVVELDFDKAYDVPGTGGATVTMIPANHCPGSSLFLFQKPAEKNTNRRGRRILHCGDFRACPAHVTHPLLRPNVEDSVTGRLKQQVIDICYLDTTYLNPRYSFPPQKDVIRACADLCASTSPDPNCKDDLWEKSAKEDNTPAVSNYFKSEKHADTEADDKAAASGQRLLVVCGTYSIGKERICVAIAKALNTKIFAVKGKMRICQQLDDPELAALLTTDPKEAQVHMQSLMEIRAETLQEYLNGYKPYFSRIIGFRPTGWTFRPPSGKQITANTSPSSIATPQILHGKGWRTRFAYKDFVAQRGSTKEAMCFGVPYSEHSSFRELALFIMSLRIEKVIPTVNIGSEQSRKRMKSWLDRWAFERRRGGLLRPLVEGQDDPQDTKTQLWDDKSTNGGGVWW